jgi:hypothetical protein
MGLSLEFDFGHLFHPRINITDRSRSRLILFHTARDDTPGRRAIHAFTFTRFGRSATASWANPSSAFLENCWTMLGG